jgi:hypothetical protein
MVFNYSQLVTYYKYFCYVVKHKFYVGIFLWRKRFYWQALTHDISKLRWFPFKTYANYFYGERETEGNSETGYSKPITTTDKDFDYAWLLHQKINPHHWQFWILLEDSGKVKLIDIPNKYIIEMICDWYGASIATGKSDWSNYKTNTKKWYLAHRDIIQMSSNSRRLLEWELEVWSDDVSDFEKETERKMSTNF